MLDTPIAEAARRLAADVVDDRMRDHVLSFADAVEHALESGQQERLSELLSSGTDVLTLWRLLGDLREQVDAQRRELLAKGEMLADLLQRVERLERDCGELREQQTPDALVRRLVETQKTALGRLATIRLIQATLSEEEQLAQSDAFTEATAKNAATLIDAAERLHEEVAALRAEMQTLKERHNDP